MGAVSVPEAATMFATMMSVAVAMTHGMANCVGRDVGKRMQRTVVTMAMSRVSRGGKAGQDEADWDQQARYYENSTHDRVLLCGFRSCLKPNGNLLTST